MQNKKDSLHFAAHSHHPWPDCTRDAHLKYWYDSADLLDEKWDYIFSEIVPRAQKEVAEILNLSAPENIAFAPNTHEFVVRLLSCLDYSKPTRILTTDSEFHSFRRQINRLKEISSVQVEIIPVDPYETFQERWGEAVQEKPWDFIFTSHVFFNSGLECPRFETWIPKCPEKSIVVIDGYHSFFALSIDLKPYEDRVFFLAGGYKYAQSGEGVCFLTVPKDCALRPLSTGWFAHFGSLSSQSTGVFYDDGGARFWGSTFDASGLYRFLSVCHFFKVNHITLESTHQHVRQLKLKFIQELQKSRQIVFNYKDIILLHGKVPRLTEAHFITFRIPNALDITKELQQNKIIVDSRGDRLRFGFGLYQDLQDIEILFQKLDVIYDYSQRHHDPKTLVSR